MSFLSALLSMVSIVAVTTAPPPQPADAHGAWPVDPHTVVRGFEPPSDAFSAGHRGVDLGGVLGGPVVASLGGTVAFAGVIAGRGVVVVNHGDTRTTYEPVIADVHLGDAVDSGDRIGTLDITQSHCFPSACLHWGWLRGDEYLDPLSLVGGHSQVRLLPLTPADAPDGTQP